jgi:uncharacterized membrane protein
MALGGMLVFMGVLHVVVPKPFEKMIPKPLGAPRFWNLLTAAAEAGAGGMLLCPSPELRRKGAWLALLTVVGVYPANIKMAIEAGPPTSVEALGLWLRLPLQYPLARWTYRHT